MINRYFAFLDKINIVRLVQIVALILFVLSLMQFVFQIVPQIIDNFSISQWVFVSMSLSNTLYSPVLLLGLAEIIKLLKKENNNA